MPLSIRLRRGPKLPNTNTDEEPTLLKEAIEQTNKRARKLRPANLRELLAIQSSLTNLQAASEGSWDEDPIFEVEVNFGKASIKLPVKAISRDTALRECEKILDGTGQVTAIRMAK